MLPVLAAWVVGMALHRLAATPVAVAAFLVVLVVTPDATAMPPLAALSLPEMSLVPPVFTMRALISVSLPLFLVTMAGQNIPGFAVLEMNGYVVTRQSFLRKTGLMSLLITAVAGLAPIPALVRSLSAAFADKSQTEAPALTFVIAASGMTLLGVSGAFWGVLVGVLIWTVKRLRP